MTPSMLIHILRNPAPFSDERVRAARLEAADLIENGSEILTHEMKLTTVDYIPTEPPSDNPGQHRLFMKSGTAQLVLDLGASEKLIRRIKLGESYKLILKK